MLDRELAAGKLASPERVDLGELTAENVGGYQSPEGFRPLLLLGILGGDEGHRDAQ